MSGEGWSPEALDRLQKQINETRVEVRRIRSEAMVCCDYRDHGGNLADACACTEHPQDSLHPFGWCTWCGGRGCSDCLGPDENACVNCGSNANPCACEPPFRDNASHLLEGTVSYGMAIPDEDPSRDSEMFEGWGPGL